MMVYALQEISETPSKLPSIQIFVIRGIVKTIPKNATKVDHPVNKVLQLVRVRIRLEILEYTFPFVLMDYCWHILVFDMSKKIK